MLRNTETSWGLPARALHWLIAALILGLFGYGLWMTEFPARENRGYHFAIHASIGISILALMIVRLGWRLMNPTPRPPANSPKWEITAARLGHLGLYVLVFATLMAGWFVAGSGRSPLEFKLFGLATVPPLLGTNSPYHRFFEEAHELLAYSVIGLVTVHAAAAIWHARVKRDGVMARMTTGTPSA